MKNSNLKTAVKQHWEAETCGTRYGSSSDRALWLKEIAQARYSLEPHIPEFADFASGKGKRVLEIGVGAGVDFSNWVKHGARATGIDLTESAISLASERLTHDGIASDQYQLLVSDAEQLPFGDNEFDIVYSWGVLHHTPDTFAAFREAFRVLKPGGVMKVMIYNLHSWTSLLIWLRRGLIKGNLSLRTAIFENLESPGTKVFTLRETRDSLAKIGFDNIKLSTKLCAGDLLLTKPSSKYQSRLDRIAWKFYPRWLVKLLGDRFGLELLIIAKKLS